MADYSWFSFIEPLKNSFRGVPVGDLQSAMKNVQEAQHVGLTYTESQKLQIVGQILTRLNGVERQQIENFVKDYPLAATRLLLCSALQSASWDRNRQPPSNEASHHSFGNGQPNIPHTEVASEAWEVLEPDQQYQFQTSQQQNSSRQYNPNGNTAFNSGSSFDDAFDFGSSAINFVRSTVENWSGSATTKKDKKISNLTSSNKDWEKAQELRRRQEEFARKAQEEEKQRQREHDVRMKQMKEEAEKERRRRQEEQIKRTEEESQLRRQRLNKAEQQRSVDQESRLKKLQQMQLDHELAMNAIAENAKSRELELSAQFEGKIAADDGDLKRNLAEQEAEQARQRAEFEERARLDEEESRLKREKHDEFMHNKMEEEAELRRKHEENLRRITAEARENRDQRRRGWQQRQEASRRQLEGLMRLAAQHFYNERIEQTWSNRLSFLRSTNNSVANGFRELSGQVVYFDELRKHKQLNNEETIEMTRTFDVLIENVVEALDNQKRTMDSEAAEMRTLQYRSTAPFLKDIEESVKTVSARCSEAREAVNRFKSSEKHDEAAFDSVKGVFEKLTEASHQIPTVPALKRRHEGWHREQKSSQPQQPEDHESYVIIEEIID